jgi:beta-lactamase regulating signal transducer with metallopeptidase domain
MLTLDLVFELAWKSLLVAGVTLGLLRLTIDRSPAERSWIAHIGLVALVLLAPIALLAPSWNPLPEPLAAPFAQIAAIEAPAAMHEVAVPTAGAVPQAAEIIQPPAAAEAWTLPSTGELALWAYLLPAALLLLTILVALVRLSAMHRRANVLVEAPWLKALAQAQKRMGFKHGTALLVSEELRSPVSWGVVRPIILLNPDAVSASREAEAIIAHELAHVARLDWAKLLISRLACALLWFNPLVWMLAREAHQLREEAADDAVLLSDVPDTDYASLLVNAARHDNKALLMAAHGVAPARNSLHRRITRVLDGGLARRPAGSAWSLLCLIVLFAIAAPLAALDPTAEPAAAADEHEFAAQPHGLGHLVSGVVSNVVPDAVRDGLAGVQGLADRADREAAAADREAHAADREASEADRLIEMKAVGLSPDYVAAMREAGFSGRNTDAYVEARAVGVTPEFARQMRQYDPSVDLDGVVEARAVGLSPAFIAGMRQNFAGVGLDEAVELAAVGVTTDFARQMRELFPGLTADQAVEMRAVGVTPEFVREMRKQGLSARTPDDAVEGRLFIGHGKSAKAKSGAAAVVVSDKSRNVAVRVQPDGRTAIAVAGGDDDQN